jgi:hypothetical protein
MVVHGLWTAVQQEGWEEIIGTGPRWAPTVMHGSGTRDVGLVEEAGCVWDVLH